MKGAEDWWVRVACGRPGWRALARSRPKERRNVEARALYQGGRRSASQEGVRRALREPATHRNSNYTTPTYIVNPVQQKPKKP